MFHFLVVCNAWVKCMYLYYFCIPKGTAKFYLKEEVVRLNPFLSSIPDKRLAISGHKRMCRMVWIHAVLTICSRKNVKLVSLQIFVVFLVTFFSYSRYLGNERQVHFLFNCPGLFPLIKINISSAQGVLRVEPSWIIPVTHACTCSFVGSNEWIYAGCLEDRGKQITVIWSCYL